MTGVYFLYSLALGLLLTLTLPWWLVQMLRLGKYRAGFWERMGFVPRRLVGGQCSAAAPGGGVAWIHAVSVGEAVAVAPLVELLRGAGWRVVVSTTTHTGQKLARARFGEENVFYFPLDLPFCISPYLRTLRPQLVVMAETEFWPNLLRMARQSGAHVAVVNARISDRSYPRYLRCKGWLARVLQPVDLFLAQSEEDAGRLRVIGAVAERVEVAGNLKFDVAPPVESEAVTQIGTQLRASGAPVLVAGSTVQDEEDYVLQAFRMVLREYPEASLVLAPRHRERFDEVADLLRLRRMKFVRRSAGDIAQQDLRGAVLLLDSLGELAAIYRYSNIAFVGGSLVKHGGHNILEPAFFSRAILTGPYTENFRDILRCFEAGGGVVRCTTKNLGITFILLLRENAEREALGARAHQVLMAQRGATERSTRRLLELAKEGQA
jgi:3-deoxy-D-manno-octulosonic-acid transferase